MGRRISSRILIAGAFFLSVMIGLEVTAQTTTQTAPHPSTGTMQAPPSKGTQTQHAVEGNPACQRIIAECKKLGFIQGQWKKDNGLWKDCFDPVVKGQGSPTRDGKPINVPASPSDVQACRAVAEAPHK